MGRSSPSKRKLTPLVKQMGYDGVELAACWGDHFDVEAALSSKSYVRQKWQLLQDHGLTAFAVSSHLVGQAICDPIDARHPGRFSRQEVWGDGDPEGVRRRAAKRMIATRERGAGLLRVTEPGRGARDDFPAVLNGFTGSSILAFALRLSSRPRRRTGRRASRISRGVSDRFWKPAKNGT